MAKTTMQSFLPKFSSAKPGVSRVVQEIRAGSRMARQNKTEYLKVRASGRKAP
jgi:hypothetical protein